MHLGLLQIYSIMCLQEETNKYLFLMEGIMHALVHALVVRSTGHIGMRIF